MEIEFLNPDKTANVKKSVILFFEVWSFLSGQAPSIWPLRYTELYSRWSNYNCLSGLGKAVMDQKQGRNLWHGIGSHSSHVISACWSDVWNILNKGLSSDNSSKRKGIK